MQRVTPWWALVMLGAVIAFVGLFSDFRTLIVGALLILIGGAGEGYTYLDVRLSRGQLTLRRESLYEAVFKRATDSGMASEQAAQLAHYAVSGVPVDGASITVSKSGNATAQLNNEASIVFPISDRRPLDADALAEELAEVEAMAWEKHDQTMAQHRIEGFEDPASPDSSTRLLRPSGQDTEAFNPITADDLLEGVAGKVDTTKRLLIYPIGRFALRTQEIKPGMTVTIGRSEECDLVVPGRMVSRVHAVLTAAEDGERVRIRDRESTNGLVVNGKAVQLHALQHKDLVQIGEQHLLYLDAAR